MTWQPVITAPKDGTVILGWGPYNNAPVTVRWARGRYQHDGWQPTYDDGPVIESQSDFGTDYKDAEVITHWMPLPTPPEAA